MTSTLPDSLALLSLDTALQIDRRLRGQPFNPDVIAELGQQLTNIAGNSWDDAFLTYDPTAAEVFSEAIEETARRPFESINEVAAYTGKIVESLFKNTDDLSTEELDSIKAFCLAFHKSMMALYAPPLNEPEDSIDSELGFAR